MQCWLNMYFVLLVCLGVVSPDLRVHWAVLVKYVFCIIGVFGSSQP